MKKLFISIICALLSLGGFAQSNLNNKADNILGNYISIQGKDEYKVRITKNTDGSYKAQIYWLKNAYDENGKKYLDVKNPDKSLRNTPSDQIVLINGLKYNASKQNWGESTIYDPQRGLKVKVTAVFEQAGKLKLRATVLGIGETVYWTRIEE